MVFAKCRMPYVISIPWTLVIGMNSVLYSGLSVFGVALGHCTSLHCELHCLYLPAVNPHSLLRCLSCTKPDRLSGCLAVARINQAHVAPPLHYLRRFIKPGSPQCILYGKRTVLISLPMAAMVALLLQRCRDSADGCLSASFRFK